MPHTDVSPIVEAVMLCIFIVVAVFGNVSLWIIAIITKDWKNSTTCIILAMSGADILVSSVNMPVIVYTLIVGGWMFSQSACVFLGFVTMTTFIASVMSLAAISINRYIMICHPNKYRKVFTQKKTALIIAGVWLLAMFLASPPLYGWAEYGFLPGQSFCFCLWKTSISFTFFMVVVCFGGPCTAMTFSYVNILREVRRSRLRVQQTIKKKKKTTHESSRDYSNNCNNAEKNKKTDTFGTTPENAVNETSTRQIAVSVPLDRNPSYKKATEGFVTTNDDTLRRKDKNSSAQSTPNGKQITAQNVDDSAMKIAKAAQKKRERVRNEEIRLTTSFLVVILAFIICWLPFCVTMFWSVFSVSPVPRLPDMITVLLGCFNSCCNPIIYGVMNSKFRSGFKRLYCEWRCCKKPATDGPSSSYQNRSSSYA